LHLNAAVHSYYYAAIAIMSSLIVIARSLFNQLNLFRVIRSVPSLISVWVYVF